MRYWLFIAPVALAAIGSACNGKIGIKGKDVIDSTKMAMKEKWDPISPDTVVLKKTNSRVEILTNYGRMEVVLFNSTPLHRDNFLKLAKSGFYNDLLFHRVKKDFMIQGGDPDSREAKPGVTYGAGGPGYTIPAEIRDDLKHFRGALCAARLGNDTNPERRSSGSQFYIVTGSQFDSAQIEAGIMDRIKMEIFNNPDNISLSMRMETYQRRNDQAAMQVLLNDIDQMARPLYNKEIAKFSKHDRQMYATWGGYPPLDGEYTVFGFLVSGYDVLDKIQSVQTSRDDRPVNDIRILKVTLLEEKK